MKKIAIIQEWQESGRNNTFSGIKRKTASISKEKPQF